jgi:hypothetical protein
VAVAVVVAVRRQHALCRPADKRDILNITLRDEFSPMNRTFNANAKSSDLNSNLDSDSDSDLDGPAACRAKIGSSIVAGTLLVRREGNVLVIIPVVRVRVRVRGRSCD